MDELERWCVAAAPLREAAQRDLEAELLKARVLAGLQGEAHEQLRGPRLGPFEVLRCLGRGGMGSVFEARDACDHPGASRLALKVLQEPDVHGLARLRREFRSLADITHPNLVTLGELYEEPVLPFFTMELVPGRSLEHIDSADVWDIARIERCLHQLFEALCALHARGVAHGDIKPSNLMLRPDDRLIVVDFGVAQVLSDVEEQCARRGSGTLAYMAPERLRGANASPCADWYAVGVVLRELLGRATQTGACTRQDRRRQELLRLAAGLSEPTLQRRLGAAELARVLGTPSLPRAGLAPEDDGVFVGRERELAALMSLLQGLRDRDVGGPQVCRVHGEPGIGKTALMERFATAATAQGALVLSGRCYEQEIARFKGFDGVIDGLARYLVGLSATERARMIPHDAASLLQVFAGLARAELPVPSQRGHADPRAVRQAAFSGLASLLQAAARARPLVIMLHDLQWIDGDGAALIAHLVSCAKLSCLLLTSHRSDAESQGMPVLARGHDGQRPLELQLAPMNEHDATQLIERLSGGTLPTAHAALTREAQGSPLLLRALLRARPMQERARDFHDLVREVLAQLDGEARELLLVAALAGRPLSLSLLARAAQLGSRPWQAVARLKALCMLRSVVREGETALAPHHDRIREAVIATLAPDAQRARHAALASAAEQLGFASQAPEFVAEQHWRAGDRPRAAHYAELAGDLACQSAALEQARVQYARALEAHAPARPAQLVAKLADAAALVGDVNLAAPLLLEAAGSLPDQVGALKLRAAEMLLLGGRPAQAMQLARPALRAQGIWLPASERAAGLLGAWELARLQARHALGADSPAARREQPADPRIETTFRLGFLFQLTLPMHGYRLLLWSTARALRHGSAPQRARALALLALSQEALGLGSDAKHDELLSRALEATRAHPLEHTFVRTCKTLILFARCDCRAALVCAEQTRSFVLQQRVPVDWVLGPIRAIEVTMQVFAGQFAQLQAARLEVERESQALGNRALCVQIDAAHAWADLAGGRPAVMRAFSDRATREWRGRQLRPLYGLAIWGEAHRRLYCGELDAALSLMRAEAPRYARSGLAHVKAWSMAFKMLWGTIDLATSRTPGDAHARAAQRAMLALRRERAPWATAGATLLEAGLLRRQQRPIAARAAYAHARRGFAVLGMQGYAAAAAYREAELAGLHARAPDAEPWFARERIADPEAWTRMYAP